MKTRAEISREECNVDPIFLLETRQTHGVSGEFYNDVDWDYDAESYRYKGRKVSEQYLLKHDMLITSWRVESVWMYREEAEAEAKRREYYYGKKGVDWRVYCVAARGDLVGALNATDRPKASVPTE